MNEIYPMWAAAHGIMIITPVNWYQVSSPLKLMMDRLVCADGGNPDPTRTHGKDAKAAKAICRQCPVRDACLDYSLRIREPHGIWGGLNEVERRNLLTSPGA